MERNGGFPAAGRLGQGHGRAADCIACGQCEGVCPQHLPIISLLKEASAKLNSCPPRV